MMLVDNDHVRRLDSWISRILQTYFAMPEPSFGDIFFNNSFQNGLLPVVQPDEVCTALRAALEQKPGAHVQVDLESQKIVAPDGTEYAFAIDPFRRDCLLAGTDNIAFTLGQVQLPARARAVASVCLSSSSMLLPLGFLLGGIWIHGGDPGLGVLLVPPGGLLLVSALHLTAFELTRAGRER